MAGRPLNSKNEQKLRDAVAALSQVIGTLEKSFGKEWNEDQPRDERGRFGSGGGGGSSESSSEDRETSSTPTNSTPERTPLREKEALEASRVPLSQKDAAAMAKSGSASNHMVLNANGEYEFTPERQAMHDEYVLSKLAGVPSKDEPTLYVMGGGPAAGKSAIIRSGAVSDIPNTIEGNGPIDAVLVNADDAKDAIPEYRALVDDLSLRGSDENRGAASFAHEESSYLAKRVQAAAYAQRSDVVLDGTGDSSVESIGGKIAGAKNEGYRTVGNYVTVDTATALARAESRGEREGRYVPASVVVETHANVSNVFPQVAASFDSVNLWDTSGGGSPTLIGQGGSGSFSVVDQGRYDAFTAKGSETLADYPGAKSAANKRLTSDEITNIYVKVVNRLPREEFDILWTPAAVEFYDRVSAEVEEMRAAGKGFAVPGEIPDYAPPVRK